MATVDWRPGEVYLLTGLRYDIGSYDTLCRPRRDDLPEGATDGVECPLAGPAFDAVAAQRVGAYLFPDDGAARAAYDERLAAYGLGPGDDGGCPFSVGDASGRVVDPAPVAACFVNEFGVANLRVFWPGSSVVVGVLGRGPDVDRLEGWARGAAGPTAGLIDPWLGSLGASTPLAACPDPERPARIAAPTTLVYEFDGIWLSDPSGNRRRRLVANGAGSAWSPDGARIAYVRGRAQKDAVRVLHVATGKDRQLALFDRSDNASGRTTSIRWSPDGRHLGVTAKWDVGDAEAGTLRTLAATWLVDPVSGDARRLHDGMLLAWSPDSSRLLLGESEREDGYGYDSTDVVEVVDIGTGAATVLGRARSAAFSSDCAFVALETPSDDGIGTVVLDGVGRRPRLATASTGSDWAPDAAELAIGVQGRGVWRVCVCDGVATRIADGQDPEWSDDGTRLAVVRRAGVFAIDADGSHAKLVARAAYPIGSVEWSPDGRFLASSEEPTYDTCAPPSYGWVIAADGSGVRSLPSPYHYVWRPVEPPRPAGAIKGQRPPRGSEGCGG